MSLKIGFATVLKAMRTSRGLTHKHMAESSSRGYMSKLEQGRSSPTVDKLTAISHTLGLSPLTLFALTLSVKNSQPIDALVQRLEAEISDLKANGALKGLGISGSPDVRATTATLSRRQKIATPSSQVELCFSD